MHFVRKKQRGQNQKVRRSWFTQDGYRILWRREIWGVRVPPRFQACVRIEMPQYGNADKALQMWDFVNDKRRLYKTLKAAQEDCEKHRRSGRKHVKPLVFALCATSSASCPWGCPCG